MSRLNCLQSGLILCTLDTSLKLQMRSRDLAIYTKLHDTPTLYRNVLPNKTNSFSHKIS